MFPFLAQSGMMGGSKKSHSNSKKRFMKKMTALAKNIKTEIIVAGKSFEKSWQEISRIRLIILLNETI